MSEYKDLKRIYYPWNRWEDYLYKFYDNCSGVEKEQKIKKAIELFNDEKLTREYMYRVIDFFVCSCEHNLTNTSLNRIAYIGQAACAIYAKIPSTVTMEAWNLLSKEVQERSDKIALEVLNEWLKRNDYAKI